VPWGRIPLLLSRSFLSPDEVRVSRSAIYDTTSGPGGPVHHGREIFRPEVEDLLLFVVPLRILGRAVARALRHLGVVSGRYAVLD